jgi:hypothetical protein
MTSSRPPTHGPSAELKGRVLAAVQAEPAPTQSTVRRRGWLTLGISAAVAVAIFAHFGGIRVQGRPGPLVMWTCLGWSVAACAAAAIAVARGRSMPGRSTAALLGLIVAAPVALLVWKIGVTVAFDPQLMVPWPGRPGFRCLGLSVAMAVPLLVALFVIRRGSDPVHPGAAGAALGVTAALIAGSLVDLWCPVADISHLLLGHILPLLLAATCGAWAGRRLLPP